MSCTHPRLMAVLDISHLTRVTEFGQVIPDMVFIERLKSHNWKINYEHQKAYRLVAKDSRDHDLENIPDYVSMDTIEIPCSNCVQCRLDYSKTWAVRCYLESLAYDHNYFVTLTYDDDNLKYGSIGNPTVDYQQVRKFIHDLRQKLKRKYGHVGVRFFGCTEYGDLSSRPHAHIILFNCPLPDLTADFPDEDGCISHHKSAHGLMYYSQIIKDCWPHGFITIEDANYNTEAYVSRYIMKKQKGHAGDVYYNSNLHVEPPRLFMSLKPGIGASYLYDNKDYLLSDPKLIIPRDCAEPLAVSMPTFYKKRLYVDHPEFYDKMVLKGKETAANMRSLLKGHQKINDNRRISEEHTIRSFEAFVRDDV